MYTILFLWLFIVILTLVLLKLLKMNKNYFVSFIITLIIILFILNLQDSIQASLVGLNLVIKTILPTIFPFSVICNLLISYDGISLYSKILGPLICKPLRLSKGCSFPIAASIIAGYPLGCKYSSDLYSLGYIEKKEYERILNIATNASPIFLIGAIGATMFGNSYYGYILLIANYTSPIIVGILTISKRENMSSSPKTLPPPISNVDFGSALKSSLENGINTTLQVGAFVIIFSILIGIIKNNATLGIVFRNIEELLNIPNSSLYGVFLGSVEFTNGCKLISSSSLSIVLKLSVISFICSFSGLSVIAQISSFVSKYNVNMTKYIFWKLIQGIVSFIITFFASYLLISSSQVSTLKPTHMYINHKIILFLYILLVFPVIFKLITSTYKKLHIS